MTTQPLPDDDSIVPGQPLDGLAHNMRLAAIEHDHKGFSEEKCTRCGWVMGNPPLNCANDNTPHVFPSQLLASPMLDEIGYDHSTFRIS